MPRSLSVTAFLVLSLVWSLQAHACPPGQYPLGGGNAGWSGCAPIYDPQGNVPGTPEWNSRVNGAGRQGNTPQAAPPPGPTGYWQRRYSAIAWARDAKGAPSYAYGLDWSSQEEAEREAMAACNEAQLKECRIGFSFYNGFVAIARAPNGGLSGGSAAEAHEVKQDVLKRCQQEYQQPCKLEFLRGIPARWVVPGVN
ncbi:DUF4189 domain-containing protein [Leeia aquatica]|uniref:DUF4189 domain-containing protein n=1 Tax=Leeia aquatica TaxID=2725557 RepID=A0A847RTC3_9NEIS|nr:DUF4189 domain-containing protein [Leeia aquatica]NLR74460.1 DUF4189 domain-containing protein [Leeia aquatica]